MNLQSTFSDLWSRVRLALRRDLREQVLQDGAVVFGANMLSLALGLVSSAVLARALGPEGLSTFAIVGATTSIAATVSDFGLRLGAIRHIAGGLVRKERRAQALARAYAYLKLLGSAAIVLLLLLFAEPLSALVQLPRDTGPTLLRIGAIAIGATLLNALAGTVLHALSLFRRLMAAQLLNVVLTVLLMTGLWFLNRLNVAMALLVGGATAVAAALLSFALLPAEWRHSIRVWPGKQGNTFGKDGRTLLSFSRWMWISNIFTILAIQMDVLLLNFFLPLPAVGIYALARNLAQKAESVNRTLHTVLAPGASGLRGADERREYAQRSFVRSLLLVGLMALATPLARPFILLLYGQEYAGSVNLFYALLLVVLLDLIISPLMLLALPLDRPRLMALADAVQVAVLLVVGVVAVPRFGAYGIILARLAGRLLAALAALPPLLRSDQDPLSRSSRTNSTDGA